MEKLWTFLLVMHHIMANVRTTIHSVAQTNSALSTAMLAWHPPWLMFFLQQTQTLQHPMPQLSLPQLPLLQCDHCFPPFASDMPACQFCFLLDTAHPTLDHCAFCQTQGLLTQYCLVCCNAHGIMYGPCPSCYVDGPIGILCLTCSNWDFEYEKDTSIGTCVNCGSHGMAHIVTVASANTKASSTNPTASVMMNFEFILVLTFPALAWSVQLYQQPGPTMLRMQQLCHRLLPLPPLWCPPSTYCSRLSSFAPPCLPINPLLLNFTFISMLALCLLALVCALVCLLDHLLTHHHILRVLYHCLSFAVSLT
jgi:hypothetical protein